MITTENILYTITPSSS